MKITHHQISAAISLLGMTKKDIADGLQKSQTTVNAIANGQITKGKSKTEIIEYLENLDIEFVDGGVRRNPRLITEYEGNDCYIEFLDDIISEKPKEVLFSGSDESLSPSTVIEKNKNMANIGIKMRSLIKNGDTYVMGDLGSYRWMPEGMFVEGDIKIIYGDYTAYSISRPGETQAYKVVKFKHQYMAEDNRRHFNLIWDSADGPKLSTSEIRYA
nr:hypothetical protein [Cytophagales bacterium]